MARKADKLDEQTFRNVEELMRAERAQLGWHKEKKLLLLLGVVVIATLGFVGLAMVTSGSKEKDLERHRCEMDYQVGAVWKETEALKKSRPDLDANKRQDLVDAKRGEFKDAARAACTGK